VLAIIVVLLVGLLVLATPAISPSPGDTTMDVPAESSEPLLSIRTDIRVNPAVPVEQFAEFDLAGSRFPPDTDLAVLGLKFDAGSDGQHVQLQRVHTDAGGTFTTHQNAFCDSSGSTMLFRVGTTDLNGEIVTLLADTQVPTPCPA
jgi:hypothetical protein